MTNDEFANNLISILNSGEFGKVEEIRIRSLCSNLVLQPSPVPLGNIEPEFVTAPGSMTYAQLSEKAVEMRFEIEELRKQVNERDKTIENLCSQINDLSDRLNSVEGERNISQMREKHLETERNVMHNKLHDIARIMDSDK